MLDTNRLKHFTRLNSFLSQQPTKELNGHDIALLNRATALAATSTNPRFKVGAIIAYRGKVISQGVNKPKTHPFQAKWNVMSSSLHAEMVALLNAQKLSCFDPEKATVVVSRIGRNKITDCSYPCVHCWNCLEYVGFRNIICFDHFGQPVRIELG